MCSCGITQIASTLLERCIKRFAADLNTPRPRSGATCWPLSAAECRGRGDTVLLRLDVSTHSGGTLLATLSQQEGFFPYRLDNFSSETLHVR